MAGKVRYNAIFKSVYADHASQTAGDASDGGSPIKNGAFGSLANTVTPAVAGTSAPQARLVTVYRPPEDEPAFNAGSRV